MTELPRVSVVVPCRNEVLLIDRCLASITASELGQDKLEVLVVDGRSDDGTQERVTEWARRDPRVRLVDNPKQIIPAAMNAGLRAATGEIILKMDAHSTYPPDYIEATARALVASGAQMVGGGIDALPRYNTAAAAAIARAVSHPWGSPGSRFRLSSQEPVEADAVAFGCWWRDHLLAIGGFDERLVRSSDIELAFRLRRAGGKIMLFPRIRAAYYPAGRFADFARRNFQDGRWAVLPYRHVDRAARLRHLGPAIVLASGIALMLTPHPIARATAILGATGYFAATLAASAASAIRDRRPGHLWALPIAFSIRHWTYAFGSILGAVETLASADLWRRLARRDRTRQDRPLPGK